MIQTKRNKQTDVGKREFPFRKQSQDACSIAEYTHTRLAHITLDSSTDTNTNTKVH